MEAGGTGKESNKTPTYIWSLYTLSTLMLQANPDTILHSSFFEGINCVWPLAEPKGIGKVASTEEKT